MRRTRRVAAVLAAALGAVCLGSTGVAHADEAPLPLLDVVVSLDPSAPRTGELVHGVRPVEGYAEAPEGIVRVDLYVVRQSLTNQPTDSPPVATWRPTTPLGRATFSFDWNSAQTPQGVVDVVVVAQSTAGRSAEARSIGIRVQQVAQAAPKPAPKAAPAGKAKAASVAAARPAAPVRRPAPAVAPKVAVRRAVPARVQKAQAAQSEAFYTAFGGTGVEAAERAVTASAAPAVPAVLRPTTREGRTLWLSVATALVLMLAAAHVQRAARVQVRWT